MPSDSPFAVAMRTQQQAEKAEQQRIKNLVLNYDLTDDQADGDPPSFHYVNASNNNVRLVGTGNLNRVLTPHRRLQQSREDKENSTLINESTIVVHQDSLTDETGAFETLHAAPRYDKSGNTRSKQRARKLQLGDIDWYGNRSTSAPASPSQREEGQTSLDQYIVDKKSTGGRGPGSRRNQSRTSKG